MIHATSLLRLRQPWCLTAAQLIGDHCAQEDRNRSRSRGSTGLRRHVSVSGTTNQNYSTTVASLGGYGYTAFQTKAITGTAGYLGSGTVGGSYVVSARTNSPSGVGTWTGYVVSDGTTHYLYNSLVKGADVRAQFRNRPQTTVQVQVSGYWRSN